MTVMTIGEAFAHLARADPDRPAVVCGDQVLTRAGLEAMTNRVARRWVAEGLRPDDLVTLALPNGVDAVVAAIAVWKAGATPQPLNPDLPPADRAAVLELARPWRVLDAPVDRGDGVDDAPLPPLAARCWKAPTSSGSTGRPKLVLSTDPAMVDPDRPVAEFVPRHAVQLVAGPLHHAAPFVYAHRGLMTGHTLVLMPRFDPGEWLRLVAAHQVTWAMLVPTMMRRIWRSPDRPSADVGSLASVLHLGARCADDLKRSWLGWLGPDRVWELYAGTESAGLALVGGREWLEHPGTVGRPVGGTRLRVVRPDGSDCAPGETGEILLRRDRPTYRYLGAPAQDRDGWHGQGDAGRLDADGRLYVADRLDDAVTTGGVTVHPAEVEAVLDAHPEVLASVVVGRPDDDLGERLEAVVQVAGQGLVQGADPPLEQELRAWVADRLDPVRRPRGYRFTTTPLRDAMGKVRRSHWR